MSRQKERKLKKLRKQTVWPYVFGIFMVIIVFSILALLITSFMFLSSAYDKLQAGFDNSLKVTEVVAEEWEEGNTEEVADVCEQVASIIPNITDICIVDENGATLYQYGENILNRNFLISMLSRDNVNFFFSDDEENILYLKENNEVGFRLESVMKYTTKEEETSGEGILQGVNLAKLNFWYEYPMSEGAYSICVRSSVDIKSTELLFASVVLDIIVILALVLIIYYLISIFSLVMERRKLGKILSTDVVTGGYNMQYFTKCGNKLLKKWKNNRHNYAVVTLRMDKYRNFCSCYGVKEGEDLLEGFDTILQKAISKKEVVAHAEKADFAMLLVFKNVEELEHRLRGILWKLDSVKMEQKKYFSVGIYVVQNIQMGIDSMYNCAGVARSSVQKTVKTGLPGLQTRCKMTRFGPIK